MKRIWIIILEVLIISLPLSIFVFNSKESGEPYNQQEIEERLNNSLTVDYEHISTEIVEKPIVGSETIYTFKDENDIKFTVVSTYIFWGFPEMVAQKDTYCNYGEAYLINYQSEVENALAEYLNKNKFHLEIDEGDYKDHYHQYGYWIRVENFEDLKKTADAVETALNAIPPFPIMKEKYDRVYNADTDSYSGAFDYASIPYIGIYTKEGNDEESFFEWIDFYCEDDVKFNKEAFIKKFKDDFKV